MKDTARRDGSLLSSYRCSERTLRRKLLVAPELEANTEGTQGDMPTPGFTASHPPHQQPPHTHTCWPHRRHSLHEGCSPVPPPAPHGREQTLPLKPGERKANPLLQLGVPRNGGRRLRLPREPPSASPPLQSQVPDEELSLAGFRRSSSQEMRVKEWGGKVNEQWAIELITTQAPGAPTN